MEAKSYLYIVFSSTPCKMGSFLRFVCGYPYNHVSISLDQTLKTLYSFARHYQSTPFYGGFVTESPLRYKNHNKYANIQICAIPITISQLIKVRQYLEEKHNHSDAYVYNMLSAAASLLHKKVKLQYAFTCVEFIVDLLEKCEIPISVDDACFYDIKDVHQKVEMYDIYQGSMAHYITPSTWGEDVFMNPRNLRTAAWLTLTANLKLLRYYFIHRP